MHTCIHRNYVYTYIQISNLHKYTYIYTCSPLPSWRRALNSNKTYKETYYHTKETKRHINTQKRHINTQKETHQYTKVPYITNTQECFVLYTLRWNIHRFDRLVGALVYIYTYTIRTIRIYVYTYRTTRCNLSRGSALTSKEPCNETTRHTKETHQYTKKRSSIHKSAQFRKRALKCPV